MKNPISSQEFMKLISDKELLEFKWPRKMASYIFKRREVNYTWVAHVFSNTALLGRDDEPSAKFGFPSEPAAKEWKRRTEASLGKPIVLIVKVPKATEEGWMI